MMSNDGLLLVYKEYNMLKMLFVSHSTNKQKLECSEDSRSQSWSFLGLAGEKTDENSLCVRAKVAYMSGHVARTPYQGFRPLDVSAYLKEDTSSMILTKSSIRWFRKRREAEPFDQFMLAFQKRRWEKD